MTNEQKQQIKNALVRFTINYSSQAVAASNLEGISSNLISQIRNNNWEFVCDKTWNSIARQVGYYLPEWKAAYTSAYLMLRILLGDAQRYGMCYGIAFAPGLGKTFAANMYTNEHEGIVYIAGNETFTARGFFTALLNSEGLNEETSVGNMCDTFINHISEKDAPVLIIDDAHRLSDRVISAISTLATKLSGKVGVVLMGNKVLKNRILDGIRLKKSGFEDLYRIIGNRFVTMNEATESDITLICNANGVHDTNLINYIIEESSSNVHDAVRLIKQTGNQKLAA